VSHPLDGVWEKVKRANQQLDALNEEWGDFVNDERNQFLAPFEVDPQSGWHLSKVGDFNPPLVRYSVMMGEVFYQLRSALDHLAWALVKANHRKPIEGTTAFPIRVWPPYAIPFHMLDAVKGIRRAAIEIIEEVQPYATGDRPSAEAHFLSVLKSFSDVDKHRALYASAVVTPDVERLRGFYRVDPPTKRLIVKVLVKPRQRLEAGTKVARIWPGPFNPQQKVYAKGSFPVHVIYGDRPFGAGDAHRGGSWDVRNDVTALIRRFAPFFPS